MFDNLEFSSVMMFVVMVAVVIFVIDMMFRLGRSAPQATEQNLVKTQNKIFYSIWFWWIFTSAIYYIFNILGYPGEAPTFFGHIAGFVGLFVPYGATSSVLFMAPFAWISLFAFAYLMYIAERDLSKKNYSLLKRILLNLLILLILTTVVDALRGTFFKSWDIFFRGAWGFH
jgi:hypothetical protein